MARLPIALQLYSVRRDCEQDLPGTLKAVAAMGYDGVEFAGYYGRAAQELRSMLDDLGLRCAGTHTPFSSILPDRLEETSTFARTLGHRYLIVPGLPEERRSSRAAWLETARIFSEASRQAKEHGMLVGYHNHWVEFQPMDGEVPWDTFFSNTPVDVVMQVDIGNALHGGGNPVPYIARFPGRALTVHLKEHSSTDDSALIGDGDVNWPEVFDLCEGIGGTEWYIVEYEKESHRSALESVDLCLRNLRAMGK
jgi:sugar phosphate isomerase/epimerase